MPPRIPDDQRAAIAADIRAGMARNDIARKHGVSGSTVSAIAKENGSTDAFDRSHTKNATEAARADNARSRSELAARFLTEAHRALDDLTGEFTAYSFGGKDNTYAEHVFPKPPPAERRNLMVIAATAADKHMAIDKHDSDNGAASARSLLAGLGEALTDAAQHLDDEPRPADPADQP